jgi:hypothetical protein
VHASDELRRECAQALRLGSTEPGDDIPKKEGDDGPGAAASDSAAVLPTADQMESWRELFERARSVPAEQACDLPPSPILSLCACI